MNMKDWMISLTASLHDHLQGKFGGVYSANNLPRNIVNFPSVFIVNTESDCHRGTHWIALYLSKGKPIEIFDSFGCDSTFYHPKLLEYINDYHYGYINSLYQYQPEDSINCACYALFYCDLRCMGLSKETVTQSFHRTDLDFNDALVTSYVRSHMSIVDH